MADAMKVEVVAGGGDTADNIGRTTEGRCVDGVAVVWLRCG